MLVYNLLLLGIIVLGILVCEWKKTKWSNAIFLSVSSVALVVIASLRAESVGVDYKMYADYFRTICNHDFSFLFSKENIYWQEPLYGLTNYLVSIFTHDVRVLMVVFAIMFAVLTAVLLYKYCSVPWVGMVVYVAYGFYGNSLCYIRQSLAISIYLFSLKFIREKKLIPYILVVLLACLFHKSLIFMLPFYFIANIKVTWKSVASFCGAALVILLLTWPAFTFISTYMFPYYQTFEGMYYMNPRDINTAVVPVLTAVVAVGLKKFLIERNPQNKVLINFSLISGLLFILTCQHFLYQRFAMMFFAAAILMIPEIVCCALPTQSEIERMQGTKESSVKGNDKKTQKRIGKNSREMNQWLTTRKYYYYDGIGAVIVVGFLYQLFLLYANRIDLVPYTTFF